MSTACVVPEMALVSEDALDRIPSSQPDVDREIERHDFTPTGMGLPASLSVLLTLAKILETGSMSMSTA